MGNLSWHWGAFFFSLGLEEEEEEEGHLFFLLNLPLVWLVDPALYDFLLYLVSYEGVKIHVTGYLPTKVLMEGDY